MALSLYFIHDSYIRKIIYFTKIDIGGPTILKWRCILQFDPGDKLKYTWNSSVKIENSPYFCPFWPKIIIFGTITTNLTENGAYHAILSKKRQLKSHNLRGQGGGSPGTKLQNWVFELALCKGTRATSKFLLHQKILYLPEVMAGQSWACACKLPNGLKLCRHVLWTN